MRKCAAASIGFGATSAMTIRSCLRTRAKHAALLAWMGRAARVGANARVDGVRGARGREDGSSRGRVPADEAKRRSMVSSNNSNRDYGTEGRLRGNVFKLCPACSQKIAPFNRVDGMQIICTKLNEQKRLAKECELSIKGVKPVRETQNTSSGSIQKKFLSISRSAATFNGEFFGSMPQCRLCAKFRQ